MVIVRKLDGAIRICCDLSLVNKAVIADRYPIPTLEELTTDFPGARCYTKLELKWGISKLSYTILHATLPVW